MICASCGSAIADKAIVCYRCGTPTAIPEMAKPSSRQGRSYWAIVPVMVAIILLGVWLIPKTTPGTPARIGAWVATWLVAFVAVTRFRSRRG